MAKKTPTLDWCVVRLGEDHNWWVDEISDDVHWDVDHLSIIDPRQIDYIIELTEPLKDYGFDPDVVDRAFIPFRIEKDAGNGRIRLLRVKGSLLDSEDKLFGLPDIVDEENGPYADFLDHVTRCRVKMLNDVKDFEEKLTVDEVEEEIREEQNNLFMEGRSIHLFTEIAAILDYVPAGWDDDEEASDKKKTEEEPDGDDDVFELDDEEEEKLKNDASLRWDEEEEGEEGEKKEGEESEDGESEDDEDAEESDEDEDDDAPRARGRRSAALDDEEEEDEDAPKKKKPAPAKQPAKAPAKAAPAKAAPAKAAAKAPVKPAPKKKR